MTSHPWNKQIVIMGAGDRGTAAALRLFHSGFRPSILEIAQPTDLHFFRNFSDAIYNERKTIDDVQAAVLLPAADDRILNEQVQECNANRVIPVINRLNATDQDLLDRIKPDILIDCSPKIRKIKTSQLEWQNFPCVIRIGFSFNVGTDGHYIIGDSGQHCGLVFTHQHNFSADQSEPEYLFKAPLEGIFQSDKRIGDSLQEREKVGLINDINILAPYSGFLSGLLHSGHYVHSGQPLFELVHKYTSRETLSILPVHCFSISGGILEAVLRHHHQ